MRRHRSIEAEARDVLTRALEGEPVTIVDLLGAHVVSALRVRGRNRPVEVWAASIPVGDQFVAATTIAEIEPGVIADRVLPVDLSAAGPLALQAIA